MSGLTRAVLAVGAAGASLGIWLWLLGLPTARVLLPDGAVGYVQGPPAVPLWGGVALGLGGTGLLWLGVGLLLSRLRDVPLRDELARSAAAYLPLLLLLADGTRLLLPLGWLTDPVVILTHEGRWVLAGTVALSVVTLLARLFARGTGRLDGRPRALALGAFAIVLIAYLAFLPRAILVGPTGDEPDYLLLAHSLLVDRDFDLANNLEQRDYLAFVGRMTPHVRPGPQGGLYNTHRLGLPAAIVPAYGVGLLAGWPVRVAVVVALALMASAMVARAVAWAAELTGHPPSALLAGLAVAFSAPGFFYAYAIYPELPVALVLVELLRRLSAPEDRRPWIVGILVASLPWFHEKFLLLTSVLSAAALWKFRRGPSSLAALLIPLGLSAALQAAYYMVLYGRPVPFGAYPLLPSLAALPNGLIGLWLDRDHGLLTLSPVYLLAILGFPAFFRTEWRAATLALLTILSLYGVVGSYREWWGGFAPAPRYLVPLLPALGVAVAFGIRAALARDRVIRVACLVGVSVLTATYAVVYPALQYRHAHPLRSLFTGADWSRYLPGWNFPDERTVPLTGLAVLGAGLWVGGRMPGLASAPPGVRLLVAGGLAVLGVSGVVLAGDFVSGAPRPHLTQETSNRELQAFLLRVGSEGAERSALALRAAGPVPPDPLRLVYEAEQLPGQAPETVEDPLAGNGLARAGGRAGLDLVFGPYETLPRGAYRAVFRLRGDAVPAGDRLAILGITGEKGRLPLAAREVRRGELSPDRYRELSVDFVLPTRTSGLEWRIRLLAPPAFRVDRITVIPLGLLARGEGAR